MSRDTSDTFMTVPRRKLRDGVLEQLLEAVERGAYRPGAELPSERELMAQMGVGRPAVREAMIKLEQRGLIAIAHGRRARLLDFESSGASVPDERIALAMARIVDRAAASADVPGARCGHACSDGWRSCGPACGSPACAAACDDRYRQCMRGCF